MARTRPRSASRWAPARAFLAALCVVAAACGGASGSTASAPKARFNGANADPTAAGNYGYGPSADARGRLQPDVVVVASGPAAIRAASDDGLTWTIGRSVPGASDLRVGSVMLATSRAVGRVVAMHDSGDDRVVTLAPVQLADVLRDGTIAYDHDVQLQSAVYQPVPAWPGAVPPQTPAGSSDSSTTQPASATGRNVVDLPPIQLVAVDRAAAGPPGTLPPARKSSVEIPIGDWVVQPSVEDGQLGLSVVRNTGSGLKVGLNLAFVTDNLHVDTSATDRGGKTTAFKFVIRGLTGIDVSIQAGAEHGGLDNSKLKFELPVNVDLPIAPSPATAGLPLDMKIGFKFSVETALTGNNSTLFATAKYGLDGPLGVDGGSVLTPAFSVKQSILDTLGGLTLGPSGIVFAVSMKTLVGVGTPAAAAGPYTSITTSIGVTNGSSLGAPLARCRGATLDIDIGGGVELSLSTDELAVLKALLPKGTKIETSVGLEKNLLHRETVQPDVPLCHAGSG